MRERAIKFLSTKLKTLPEDVMTKEVEEYVFAETKKVCRLTSDRSGVSFSVPECNTGNLHEKTHGCPD